MLEFSHAKVINFKAMPKQVMSTPLSDMEDFYIGQMVTLQGDTDLNQMLIWLKSKKIGLTYNLIYIYFYNNNQIQLLNLSFFYYIFTDLPKKL